MGKRIWLLIHTALVIAVACGGTVSTETHDAGTGSGGTSNAGSAGTGGALECAVGTAQTCACADGSQGTQKCEVGGMFGPCDCGASEDSGPCDPALCPTPPVGAPCCVEPGGACGVDTPIGCSETVCKCDGDRRIYCADGSVKDCAPARCSPDGLCRTHCTSGADCVVGARCVAAGACKF